METILGNLIGFPGRFPVSTPIQASTAMHLALPEPVPPALGAMSCAPVDDGLIYGSVCSGIEAATVAWEPLGWRPAFLAEIEPFPSAVLAHHYPAVPNLGDMAAIDGAAWRGRIDVLVGGTPCQAFSVAGRRRSLDDARGNLTLTFVDLADAIDPTWIVWDYEKQNDMWRTWQGKTIPAHFSMN